MVPPETHRFAERRGVPRKGHVSGQPKKTNSLEEIFSRAGIKEGEHREAILHGVRTLLRNQGQLRELLVKYNVISPEQTLTPREVPGALLRANMSLSGEKFNEISYLAGGIRNELEATLRTAIEGALPNLRPEKREKILTKLTGELLAVASLPKRAPQNE